MKQILLCVLFFSFLTATTTPAFTQELTEGLTYNITVFDNQGQPKSGLPIVIIETSTFERKAYALDQNGKLQIKLNEGSEWALNIGEMRNYAYLHVPQGGMSTGSTTTTYDLDHWNRINQKPVDRSQLQIEDIPVRVPYNARPSESHELLEVEVVSQYRKPYMGMEVKLTCFALGESYSAQTDNEGIARFLLPINQQYQIDVDGETDISYHDVGPKAYKKKVTLTYETMKYREKVNEDGYIEQTFLEDPRPISGRVFVALTVYGGPNGGTNEDVYLEMAYTGKKYHGVTNENGNVYFMLPKSGEYKIHFKYQPDAGSIDLKRFYGIGEMSTGVMYVPEERLMYPERFLPTKDEVKQYDINNFSDKKFPDDGEGDLINVHAKFGCNKINSGSQEAILELGFSVNEPENKTAISKPLNIAFVLDKSGSMMGENIDLLKSAMFEFIDKLRPIDKVAIVFFDTEAVLAHASSLVNKAILKDIVGAVKADGGTSIYEGLKLGYEEVKKNKSDNSVNRVILLTDGYGSKPVDEVIELSKGYFEHGISVSTIGVGTGYNSALLTLLSQYSGGLEHQAINSDGISEALEAEMESLMYPLASDLVVTVKYDDVIIYKTLYGVPESKNKDGKVEFKLDKVYSSLNRMVLMKFKLENPGPDIADHKITIETSYYDEVKKTPVNKVKMVQLEWTEETDIEMIYDQNLKNTYSIAIINQMMKVLADQCDAKDYIAARKTINETLKSIKKINSDQFTPELLPIVEELYTYMEGVEQALKNQGK